MICKHCGSDVKSDCRYCPHCGSECKPDKAATLGNGAITALVPTSQGFAVPALSSADLHTLLTQANLLKQRRAWEQAIDCCITVLRADPGNPTAHALLGEIYYGQQKLHDAVHWFRLAVELHPNPNDVARLRELEEEARRGVAGELIATGNKSLLPIHADGGYSTGTAQLMGLPPRTYLNIITAASIGFMALMLMAILMYHSARKSEMPPVSATASSLPNTRVLPLNNRTPLFNSALSAGQNFPSNVAAQIAKTRDAGQPRQNSSEGGPKPLPTAPILGVRSLPPDSASRVRPEPPKNETSKPAPTLPLPGEMTLAATHLDPISGAVSLLVVAPTHQTTTLTENERNAMLRNVYRAARIYFATETKSQHIAVYVQSGKSNATMMLAEISRMTSDAVNPEIETPDTLESRLLSLKSVGTSNTSPVLSGVTANEGSFLSP